MEAADKWIRFPRRRRLIGADTVRPGTVDVSVLACVRASCCGVTPARIHDSITAGGRLESWATAYPAFNVVGEGGKGAVFRFIDRKCASAYVCK